MVRKELLGGNETSANDYHLLFIHTHLSAAQLAWTLDQSHNSSFWLMDNRFSIQVKKGISEHDCFMFVPKNQELCFWLLSNAGSAGFLVKIKPRPDLLVIGSGEGSVPMLDEWMQSLKQNTDIQIAYMAKEHFETGLNWLSFLSSDPADWSKPDEDINNA